MRIHALLGRVYLYSYSWGYIGGYGTRLFIFVLFIGDYRPGHITDDSGPGTDSPCRRSPSAKPWRKWGDGGQSRRLAAMPLRPP